MSLASGPCSMCEHFSMEKMPKKLRKAGFGNCSERPAWGYMSQAAACAFDPSRFEERSAQAIPVPGSTADDSISYSPHRIETTAPIETRVQPAPCDLPEEIDFGRG